MKIKNISLILLLGMSAYSSTLSDIKKQTLNNNQDLKIIQNDIKVSKHSELLSTKWKNIVLGFGMNDLQLNDFTSRDIEPMQNQFISLSQKIPLSNELNNKRDIQITQSKIYSLLLEDKKVKYNSLIHEYLNEYVILQKRVWLLSNLKKNIKTIQELQEQKFKLTGSEQINIINSSNKYVRYDLEREALLNKLEILKLKLENISYSSQNKIIHSLEKQTIEKVNIQELLKNNFMYKALKEKIKKSKQNIDLEKSKYTNDINFKIAYYQREKFEDYLSFSISYPLSIYGSEDIKINRAKEKYLRSKSMLIKFENEFKIKVKSILFDMELANNNYDLIISKVVANKKIIREILKSQGSINKLNSIKQLKNSNSIIEESLRALTQQSNFYKAKAKLKYFQGEKL